MEERIKEYIDSVFKDVPHCERNDNIKNEIYINLLDKYHDLINEGRNVNEAYAVAISSGGDLSGIVADLKGEQVNYNYNYEKQFEKMYEKQYKREKRKCSKFASWFWPSLVGLYLLVSFIFQGFWYCTWILFILGASVQNFYEFVVKKSNKKARMSALSGGIWTLTTAIYFILSFATMRWDITWILFIVTIGVENLVKSLINNDEVDDNLDD